MRVRATWLFPQTITSLWSTSPPPGSERPPVGLCLVSGGQFCSFGSWILCQGCSAGCSFPCPCRCHVRPDVRSPCLLPASSLLTLDHDTGLGFSSIESDVVYSLPLFSACHYLEHFHSLLCPPEPRSGSILLVLWPWCSSSPHPLLPIWGFLVFLQAFVTLSLFYAQLTS